MNLWSTKYYILTKISCQGGSEIIGRNPKIGPFLESAINAEYQISFEELVAFVNSKFVPDE